MEAQSGPIAFIHLNFLLREADCGVRRGRTHVALLCLACAAMSLLSLIYSLGISHRSYGLTLHTAP